MTIYYTIDMKSMLVWTIVPGNWISFDYGWIFYLFTRLENCGNLSFETKYNIKLVYMYIKKINTDNKVIPPTQCNYYMYFIYILTVFNM